MKNKFNIKNGFAGIRVDGSSEVWVDVGDNPEIIDLMVSKDVNDWDKFCEMLPEEHDPRGEVHISHLIVNGKEKVFH